MNSQSPIDTEKATLLKPTASRNKPTSTKVAKKNEVKESKSSDAFNKIIQSIIDADPKDFPQLHDPMMKSFCAATELHSSKTKVEVLKVNEHIEFYDEESKKQKENMAKFAYTLVSPNGEFAAGVTHGSEVVVFDLKHTPSSTTPKFFKFIVEGKREKKAPIPTEDSMDIPEEEGIHGKMEKYQNIKEKANDDDLGADGPKTDILIDFSNDSALLAVARNQVIDIYNCRECFSKQDPNEAKLDWDITEEEFAETGKLRFIYFYRPCFENTLYQSPDREMLMIGYDAALMSRTIIKDNLSKDKFHVANSDDAWTKEEQMNTLESDNYAHAMKEAGDAEIWTNRSNYIYFRKKDTLFGYRIDWDNEDDDKRFILFCEYKLNKKHKLFPYTFSPNGKFIFVYNEKSSQIQKLILDTKGDTEDVYNLTGKKKNFKHLAVKGDGKYLLIVDSHYKAEVLIRSGKNYAVLTGFEASYEPEVSTHNIQKPATSNKEKKTTEQDLSDMDFLEDGSGLVVKIDDTILIVRVRLPTARLHNAVHLKQHFYDSNFRIMHDGRYTFDYHTEEGRYQKIVDFDPDTNGGCIVRSFYTESYAEQEDLLNFMEHLYASRVQWDYMASQGYGSYKDQISQLEMQVNGNEEVSREAYVLSIPNSDLILFYLNNNMEMFAYKKDFHKEEDPQPVYHISLDEMPFYEEEIRKYSPFFIDQFGQYIFVPQEKGAKVYSSKTGEEHCAIEDGFLFYNISKSKVLVCLVEEPAPIEATENEQTEIPELKFHAQIFDLEKKTMATNKIILNARDINLIKTVEINGKELAVFIADNRLVIFDVASEKIVSDYKVIEDDPNDKILVCDQFQAHCALLSPDGKFLALSSKSDCDTVKIFPISDKSPGSAPYQIKLKVRSDRINRWCFDKDSKFFLIKIAEGINVYSVNNWETPVCMIPLDEHVAKFAKVLTIKLTNDSQNLEIAFGYKNYVYMLRMPFMPTVDDLMLPYLSHKLVDYLSDRSAKSAAVKGTQIALIMSQQQDFQKRLDKTYIKILCMMNSKTILDKFFENLSDESDLILATDDFPALVLMKVKNEKGKLESKMNKSAANSYIDLIQSRVEQDKKFPPVKRAILDEWLVSELLDVEYMRKLLKLITFEPVNTSLKGQLKRERRLAVSLNAMERLGDGDPIQAAKDHLVNAMSTDQTNFHCYKTAIGFDLENGSEFSVNYFRWLADTPDDDLQYLYKSIIFYKWAKVLPWAIVYSVMVWILNALYVAYMGFAYHQLGLLITIVILNILFIAYEIKCFVFTFKDSVRDLWNYYDFLIHLFSIFSVFFVYYNHDDSEAYKYSWLRLISFVLISLRAFTMMRVFSATRYLIVMLLEVFKDMVAFLSVFFYIIFIYLFVCLIRTNLTPDGEDTPFYEAVKQGFNIAFSNFDAEVDSVIVLITTVAGQIVLGLVLLNYLIAIVNATYARISKDRDLHDMRMLLDVIREFDCFFNIRAKFSERNSERIFLIATEKLDSNTMADLRTVFTELKQEQKAAITKETEAQKAALEIAVDTLIKTAIAPLTTQVAEISTQIGDMETAVKAFKKKLEDERSTEKEQHGKMIREAEERKRKEQEELRLKMQNEREEVERRMQKMQEDMEAMNKLVEEGKASEEQRKLKEELDIQLRKELARKDSIENKIKEEEDPFEEEDSRLLHGSTMTDMSVLEDSEQEESENDFDNRSVDNHEGREVESEAEEEYDPEGECEIQF